ncbi:uncharacterized protein KQ657_000816 [Scheffersomyces spartinae]|uniref:Golgi apyrase n=1 Tax=Scheffersomyces spartinae TaxID=45513 RepID=A0A9P7V8S5_9ASCO|nr:uncharacterized protein KQ657_000816 [Scheffersomyces spartinae]KAG7193398.1 hypothetical protein KQ657_000816 [Scheffersomyces spartinae]
MNTTEQDKRSKHKDKGLTYKQGPIYNEDSIPYDYIVIIDAGSSGSRVYVYNWLNPLVGLEKGIDFRKLGGGLIRLVKRFHLDHRELEERTAEDKDVPERERKTTTEVLSKEDKQHGKDKGNKVDTDDKEESEDDTDIEDDQVDTEEHSNYGDLDANNDHKQVDSDGKKGVSTKKPSKSKPKKGLNARLPVVKNGKKWHKKIRPGISSFNASPRKIGNHHIKGLLTMAASIVPKSQHYRTPIFLHSTAGMRLLNPTEQQTILDTICEYLQSNSDFFVPECSSHINVITGDVEGIYGWLSINSLIGSFDTPEQHNHGKNHTTYGLLDMGGASTQVVFSPNSTEIEEHQNNLYKIKLSNVPTLLNANATYSPPDPLEFDLYSDSFLGFGMFQAHNRYLSFLVDKYRKEHNLGPEDKYYNTIGAPVPDPCLPRGYVSSEVINDYKVDFTGESDFKECLNNIFPVLSNSTYSGTDRCKQIDEPEVSSCLLNDLIPAFDFDINHFFGVSGYWDAINSLLAYDEKLGKRKKKKKNKGKEKEKENEESSDPKDGEASTYDYKVIYDKTSKLCAQSWSKLLEMNNKKKEKSQLDQDELSELCFKASWILNFLHVGLGFPRFGIDEATSHEKQKFQNLQLVESLGGSQFSWTLGRAILYANDEYVQAFNNYTLAHTTEMNDKSSDITPVRRPGFYHSASSSVYRYGAEQQNVVNRPAFVTPDPQAKYKYYDYEKGALGNDSELKWYIEPHRWYGIFILSFMMMFIFWLMLGKSGRNRLREKTSRFTGKVLFKFNQIVGAITNKTFSEEMPYYPVANSSNQFVVEEDLEEGLELATITKNGNSSTDSQFTINSA